MNQVFWISRKVSTLRLILKKSSRSRTEKIRKWVAMVTRIVPEFPDDLDFREGSPLPRIVRWFADPLPLTASRNPGRRYKLGILGTIETNNGSPYSVLTRISEIRRRTNTNRFAIPTISSTTSRGITRTMASVLSSARAVLDRLYESLNPSRKTQIRWNLSETQGRRSRKEFS